MNNEKKGEKPQTEVTPSDNPQIEHLLMGISNEITKACGTVTELEKASCRIENSPPDPQDKTENRADPTDIISKMGKVIFDLGLLNDRLACLETKMNRLV